MDLEEAARLFRLSAEQGLAGAQYCLAFMLCTGQGTDRDTTEGIKWARLAASTGDATALQLLEQIPPWTPGSHVEVHGLTSEAGQVRLFAPICRPCRWCTSCT